MQILTISDDEGGAPSEVDLLQDVSKPAVVEDPFAKLLESPELPKLPRGLSSRSTAPDTANQQLVQRLKQQLADFERNSSATELDDPDEAVTGQ